jgi:hypothetical protein
VKRKRAVAKVKVDEEPRIKGPDDVNKTMADRLDMVLIVSQGFAAMLEPFYSNKKLTDPIDTAKVPHGTQRSLAYLTFCRTNGTSCQLS